MPRIGATVAETAPISARRVPNLERSESHVDLRFFIRAIKQGLTTYYRNGEPDGADYPATLLVVICITIGISNPTYYFLKGLL